MIYNGYFPTAIGLLEILAEEDGIKGIHFTTEARSEHPNEAIKICKEQLEEYFAGKRKHFDLPLAMEGTSFQQAAWHQLQKIPFGDTISYQEQATAIGRPRAVRAVGGANSKNPLAIVVPCHRVVGKSGHLTGYAGGLDRKRWLLAFEQSVKNKE